MKKSSDYVRFSIILSKKTKEKLRKISYLKNEKLSETIRRILSEGAK